MNLTAYLSMTGLRLHLSILISPSALKPSSPKSMTASAKMGIEAISMIKSFVNTCPSSSFGNWMFPFSLIGIIILPYPLVAMKVFAAASTITLLLPSWIYSLSSPRAKVSRPSLPATNIESRVIPTLPAYARLGLMLPLSSNLFMLTEAKMVSRLSV